MRLATILAEGENRVVGVSDGPSGPQYVDLQAVDADLPRSLRALLALEHGISRAAAAFEKGLSAGRFVTGTLQAPITNPGKVICIGLNYRDHAAESGMDVPTEPICFSKFSSAVVGPEGIIEIPAVVEQADYEAEMVVVIGQRGRNISEADAQRHVAGFMNGNDVSARDWQIGRPGGQWLLGKTPDTFAPTGPWLVTVDEIADPHRLAVQLRLNGETMQDSNTREFIFRIEQVIAHISQLVTLEPGDLIFTGTPPGVGFARKPPVFLEEGDVVEVEIEGLGVLRNHIGSHRQGP